MKGRFGTYYHNHINLSVKLVSNDCSIVFGVAGDADTAANIFALTLDRLGLTSDTNVSLDIRGRHNGLTLLNARTTASQ